MPKNQAPRGLKMELPAAVGWQNIDKVRFKVNIQEMCHKKKQKIIINFVFSIFHFMWTV